MTTTTPQPNLPGDDLDRLLTAYFQAEMPAKWPAPPSADERSGVRRPVLSAAPTDPTSRSRWALAASVAILIGGCWYLSGLATDGRPKKGLGLDDGQATPPKLIKDHMGPPKGKMP